MERFGKVALSIRNLSSEITMHHMKVGGPCRQ